MEDLTSERVNELTDNLTVIKRLKYTARRVAYYASNYGLIINYQNNGKISVLKTQTNRAKREGICNHKHGNDKRPSNMINSADGPLHNKKVYRLVAEAFCPNSNALRNQVDHIDNNPANNRADNLRWCTQRENCRYAREIRRGERIITNLQKSLFYATQ